MRHLISDNCNFIASNYFCLMKFLLNIFLSVTILTAFCLPSCKRNFAETDAFAVVDKISLTYGNERIFHTFTITNTGEKNLNYLIDEDIEWLEIASNPSGQIPGNSYLEVTCRVSRTGFSRNNYQGVINVKTGTGDFTIEVFMMVDMFAVTFINPVFSTIELFFDTIEFQGNEAPFRRLIGTADSIQFGFFSKPAVAAYYGQTSGRYADSSQLGLAMEWKGSQILTNIQNPRFSLNISKAYFHLSILNTFQVLTPLFVNPGTPFEKIENIYISQSPLPQPIGYYQALGNTSIRAFVAGSSSTVTWSNFNHFTLSDTINQSVLVASYNSDTIPQKSVSLPPRLNHLTVVCDDNQVIRILGHEKQ
jgi:hypothetical protein